MSVKSEQRHTLKIWQTPFRTEALQENPIFQTGVGDVVRREIRRETIVARSHSGPLPPPSQLKAYDDAIPGLGERIVVMAEKEQTHRHTSNRALVSQNAKSQNTGMWLGFVICVFAIIAGLLMVLIGGSPWGIAAIIAPLAALVGVFVYAQKNRPADSNASLPAPTSGDESSGKAS